MSKAETAVGRKDAQPTPQHSTALRTGTIGVAAIVFFVFSAQAPLTGIAGATGLAVGLGNGAGAPGAYLVVGGVILLFAVGFVAVSRRVETLGGFYAYVTAAFGRPLGGSAAWLAMLTYVSVQAGMLGLYGASFSVLLDTVFGVNIPWWLPALITAAFVYYMGTRNIEVGARFLAVLVVLETSILLAFAVKVLLSGGGPEGLDAAASFSPGAIMSGAPGIAIMFAVGSMYGFESTAIYSAEAKDPKRTIARATYLSVCLIAGFLAFVAWMITSFYGPSQVTGAAQAAIEAGDSPAFVIGALVETLGPWAGIASQVLLLTSLLAGVLALHNSVNRYFHALALSGSLPQVLGHTNKHLAPSRAGLAQLLFMVALMLPFAVLNLDPVLTLFTWLAGLSVVSLLLVYALTSVAVVAYFRKDRRGASTWQSVLAPGISTLLLLGLLGVVVANFTQLVGGDETVARVLLAVVPICFLIGAARERRKADRPLAVRQ